MFTIIGVLLLLAAITFMGMAYAIPKTIKGQKRIKDPEDPYATKVVSFEEPNKTRPAFLNNAKYGIIMLVLGIFIIGMNGVFFYNPPGTVTSIQYLWGGDKMVASQGIKLKYWGRTIPVSFEIAMQDIIPERDAQGKIIDDRFPDEEGIYYRSTSLKEFADAIKADVGSSVIVAIDYSEEDKFLDMADKNRSEEKLVYARVYPVYDQALKNTCKLMDAQDYVSGASSQFDFYLKDQMENGMYLTEEIEIIISKGPIVSDSNTTVAHSGVEKKEKKYRIVYLDSLKRYPKRDTSNSLKRYGLTVRQAAITGIDWEHSFDKRLDKQKEQVALAQLEIQETETEYYATAKEVAKGEKEKAQIRVQYEKEQVQKTIAAKTKALEASYALEEQTNLAEAAVQTKIMIKTLADAEYYKNQKLVQAGLTPQERVHWDYRSDSIRAVSIKDLKLPNEMTIINSGGESGGVPLEALIGANMAKGLLGKTAITK